jgi:glutamine synthetase
MSKLRFKVLKEAATRMPIDVAKPSVLPSELFESHVFTREKMRAYIDNDVLKMLFEAIDKGKPIGRDIASAVAMGMKKWAVELGATHYTHWFQPLTGSTAEKHDAFINKEPGGKALEEFTGKLLYQQEPDASSFPSGGIRNTFEARGYSAWDPSSPAFVVGDTLCIPTIFVAYTGEALDYKAPLLRSISAINSAATDVCRYFDRNVSKVYSYLGWEQEYFLVDEALYAARPDLMLTGRTLMGHESAKNQQLEDHYFGAIPERVLNFMTELEIESLKLGVPVKTRHNEVAPNQFELAPIYEEVNLANDHNLLLMSIMERVARKHHFRVLLHEKPFAGVNGSGKHNNWSIGTDTGINLLAPGKNRFQNLQFITFLVNILMAVHRHNALLKASISSATNAHRLGANEAPPAIVSVFLGAQITEILNKLEKSSSDEAIIINAKKEMKLGVGNIPELLLDNTDRNRTSPFAFTGNRFEFRAVGSSANCGAAMLTLNSVVADQLSRFKNEVDALIEKGNAKERALFSVIKKYIKESKPVRYEGNGYSEEWKLEAQKRGLDCETSVPLIFDAYLVPKTVEMFKNTDVLNEKELHSRCDVKWETYTKKIQIEARVLGDLVKNHIVPVASRYQSILLDNTVKMNEVFGKEEAEKLTEQDRLIIRQIAEHTSAIIAKVNNLIERRKVANAIESVREKAIAYHDKIVPLLDEIRVHVDKLELIIDDEMWSLPKYRELLFIR